MISKIVDASLGFKSARYWQVQTPDGVRHIVLACDNYTACEAVGSRFSECQVSEFRSAGSA